MALTTLPCAAALACDREYKGYSLWKCKKREICRAPLTTSGHQIVKLSNDHSHVPSPSECEVTEAKHNLRKMLQPEMSLLQL
jgi:hypothetical protein